MTIHKTISPGLWGLTALLLLALALTLVGCDVITSDDVFANGGAIVENDEVYYAS